MTRLVALVLVLIAPAVALAQREARAGAVRIAAQDTLCWSNSQVPCETIGRAEIEIRTGAAPARVRVVSVEVMPNGGVWQSAPEIIAHRETELTRTIAPRRPGGVVRFAARERDVLVIHFTPIRAFEGRVRVTLDVDGRRATVEAAHTVTSEHPDPEL